ncbi:MAG: hypothetical protein JXM79_15495 [Sedimentisphaerales bacterium]|nr:hypothetical protein [Sedimentisphaerales bacterium]
MLEFPDPAEFTLERDARAEEMLPGMRMLDVVFLDCRVVICGTWMFDLDVGREEIPERDGDVIRGELVPELRLLPLLLDDEAEEDAFRFSLACKVDSVIIPTLMKTSSANI